MKSLGVVIAFAASAGAVQALPPVLGPASASTNLAAGGILGPDGGDGRATSIYNPAGGQKDSGPGSRSVDGSCPQLPACPSLATSYVQYGPLPSITTTASSGLNGTVPDGWILPYNPTAGSASSATMQYQFTAYGPANTTVFVELDSFMKISGTGVIGGRLTVGSSAGFSVIGPDGTPWVTTRLDGSMTGTRLEHQTRDLMGNSSFTLQPSGNQFTEFEIVPFAANTVYTIALSANASAISQIVNGSNATNGSAYAYVDPRFTIDPSTPNAAAYSLLFSDGVGNAAPVPEPAQPALWAAGLCALAGRRLRQRRLKHGAPCATRSIRRCAATA